MCVSGPLRRGRRSGCFRGQYNPPVDGHYNRYFVLALIDRVLKTVKYLDVVGASNCDGSSWGGKPTRARFNPRQRLTAVQEGFVFTPHEARANVGDVISASKLCLRFSHPLTPSAFYLGFNFYPGGHRVARAAFGKACIPYEDVTLNKKGFDSGAQSPQVVTSNVSISPATMVITRLTMPQPPHFDVRVNDTDPIFYYCAAPGSCVNHHMIGVINPNETETYDDQLKFAQNATFQMAPGDPWPSETPLPSPRPSSSSSASSSSGGSSGLSSGAIAGIAIGGAAVLVLAAALIYLCGRRGGFDKAYRKSAQQGPAPALPDMVDPSYTPKSPGRATLSSSFAGHDSAALHASMLGTQTPYLAQTPSPNPSPSAGQVPGYGFVAAPGQGPYDPHYA